MLQQPKIDTLDQLDTNKGNMMHWFIMAGSTASSSNTVLCTKLYKESAKVYSSTVEEWRKGQVLKLLGVTNLWSHIMVMRLGYSSGCHIPLQGERRSKSKKEFQEMDNVSVTQQCQWVCQLQPFVITKSETLVALKISECFPHNM